MPDRIEIEILDDGRVKVITPKIGVANHRNAEELLKLLQELLGGGVADIKRTQGQVQKTVRMEEKA